MTPEERYNIKGVNKLFFEASMNDKYRNLSLVSQDGFNFVETMEKLLMPGVAIRVRTLTIWPEDICRAIYPEQDERPRFKTVPVDKKPDTRWKKAKGRAFKKDDCLEPECTVIQLPDLPKPPARLRMFKEALRGLTNLEELSIKRRRRSEYPTRPLPDQISAFLPICMQECIWPVVKKSVRKLTLDVDNRLFEAFIPGPENFPKSIQHLVLVNLPDEMNPFVRQLTSSDTGSLKKLSIEGDCRTLWSALEIIPNLRDLELRVPAWIILEQNTQPWIDIHKLLMDNAGSIQHLSIIPVPKEHLTGSFGDTTGPWSLQPGGGDPSKPLHELRSLKVSFPWLKELSPLSREWTCILDYYALLGQHATSLTVHEPLSPTALDRALRAFDRNRRRPLQELYLDVQVLSPGVVDTIVEICPNLVKLHLKYGTLSPGEVWPALFEPSTPETILAKITQQIKERRHHPCPSLIDISLMTYVQGKGFKYHLPLMRAYAEVFPSIVSFAGVRDASEEGLALLEPKVAFLDATNGSSAAWS
ncbi:hypothetical protein MD484_g5776, partial [Candolleomyces efflorescens]